MYGANSSIVSTIKIALPVIATFMYIIKAVVILGITLLIGKIMISREESEIRIFRVIGYKTTDLSTIGILRFVICTMLGNTIGIIAFALCNNKMFSIFFSSIGIESLGKDRFLESCVLGSAIIMFFSYIAAYTNYKRIKKMPLR